MLSRNGFKSAWFGPRYWMVYHSWANQSSATKKSVLKRFYESPKYLLPCIFCRNSYASFLEEPGYDLESYFTLNKLPEWVVLMHNQVNRKLEKPCASLKMCKHYQRGEKEWIAPMWDMLFSIALNYPTHFNFWQQTPTLNQEEHKRFAAYHWLFSHVDDVMPEGKMSTAWKRATQQYPLTSYALSSRQQLVSWLHQVALESGSWTLPLVKTIKHYEQYRASGCHSSTQTCQ